MNFNSFYFHSSIIFILIFFISSCFSSNPFDFIGFEDSVAVVQCSTTADPNPIEIYIPKKWSPFGAERFLKLVEGNRNLFFF